MIVQPGDLSLDEIIHYNELLIGEIHLDDEISSYIVRDVMRDMEYARSLGAKELTLFINSPGGGVYDAIGLYDFIMELRKTTPVTGVVRGLAASAASMVILQATKPRTATPHSRFLLHEPSKWGRGSESVSSVQDSAEELARIHNIILSILAERSHKDISSIRTDLVRREVWMSAIEAMDWGLIDTVLW